VGGDGGGNRRQGGSSGSPESGQHTPMYSQSLARCLRFSICSPALTVVPPMDSGPRSPDTKRHTCTMTEEGRAPAVVGAPATGMLATVVQRRFLAGALQVVQPNFAAAATHVAVLCSRNAAVQNVQRTRQTWQRGQEEQSAEDSRFLHRPAAGTTVAPSPVQLRVLQSYPRTSTTVRHDFTCTIAHGASQQLPPPDP
jgi:hypothetical protein